MVYLPSSWSKMEIFYWRRLIVSSRFDIELYIKEQPSSIYSNCFACCFMIFFTWKPMFRFIDRIYSSVSAGYLSVEYSLDEEWELSLYIFGFRADLYLLCIARPLNLIPDCQVYKQNVSGHLTEIKEKSNHIANKVSKEYTLYY
jgi:hypothetical protein